MKIASKSNVRRLSAGARSYRALLSTATVGFAFVFVASAVALLAGYLPNVLTAPLGQIDTGVVLLFAPLCALALGMVAEVVRSAFTQKLERAPARLRPALSDWTPGMGEG